MTTHFQKINSVIQQATHRAKLLVNEGWDEVTESEAVNFWDGDFSREPPIILIDLYKAVLMESVQAYYQLDDAEPEGEVEDEEE